MHYTIYPPFYFMDYIIFPRRITISVPQLKQIYIESQFLFLLIPQFFLSFSPMLRNKDLCVICSPWFSRLSGLDFK